MKTTLISVVVGLITFFGGKMYGEHESLTSKVDGIATNVASNSGKLDVLIGFISPQDGSRVLDSVNKVNHYIPELDGN